MTEYTLPVLGYYNSCLTGLIKVKILEDMGNTLKVKITHNKGAYRRGEILNVSKNFTFPRAEYHKTGIFSFRVDPYSYKEGQ